jgi:hypothetical protein
VQTALSQVEKQSPTFLKRSGCNSCHNQYLPSAAMVLARERGLTVPRSVAEVSLEMREVSPERVMDLDTFGVTSLGYEMFRNAAVGQPADEYTDAVVHFIKVMQTPAGDWENTGNRPPLTYDRFITAALAINTEPTDRPAGDRRLAALRRGIGQACNSGDLIRLSGPGAAAIGDGKDANTAVRWRLVTTPHDGQRRLRHR